jgi:tetratricopeptide (TPR) repeat protein
MGFFEEDFEKIQQLVEHYEQCMQFDLNPVLDEEDFESLIQYYIDNNKFQEALEVSNQAIQRFPFSVEFTLSRADVFLEMGNYEEAESLLSNSHFVESQEINYFLILSELYLLTNRLDESENLLIKALKVVDEGHDDLYLQLCDVYSEKGEYKKCIMVLKKAIEYNGDNSEAYYNIAYFYSMTDAVAKKIDFFKELINKDPFNLLAWIQLYHSYREVLDFVNAKDTLQYILAIDPINTEYKIELAYTHIDLKEYQKAIEMLEELRATEPLSPENLITLGIAYKLNNQSAKAKKCFKDILVYGNLDTDVYYKLAMIYVEENNFFAALPLAKKAVELDPTNIEYKEMVGNIYLMKEEPELAYKYFFEVYNEDKENKEIQFKLILSLYFSEEEELANNLANEFIEVYDHYELYFVISFFLFSEGKVGEAKSFFELGLVFAYEHYYLLFNLMPELENNPDLLELINSHNPE